MNVTVSRAVLLGECLLRELPLYLINTGTGNRMDFF